MALASSPVRTMKSYYNSSSTKVVVVSYCRTSFIRCSETTSESSRRRSMTEKCLQHDVFILNGVKPYDGIMDSSPEAAGTTRIGLHVQGRGTILLLLCHYYTVGTHHQ